MMNFKTESIFYLGETRLKHRGQMNLLWAKRYSLILVGSVWYMHSGVIVMPV